MTKTQRTEWEVAIGDAQGAIGRLIELQSDLQMAYDEHSETWQQSEKGESVRELCDVDFQQLDDELSEASSLLDSL
jgi:hypothetical protein